MGETGKVDNTSQNMEDYKTFEKPNPSSTSTLQSTLLYKPGESRRMLRNVIVISVAFTLLFTAYSFMSNLQSSLNPEEGLGNWSSSTVYASMVISALFIPTAFIRRVTVKWAIFIVSLSLLHVYVYTYFQFQHPF